MKLLSNVTKGKIEAPHFILIYGPDGVGKSTFGASAPAPIFLGSEDGSNNLDVHRFPLIKEWSEAKAAITELIESQHEYKTLVVDSLDWLEMLNWKFVCETAKVQSIEDAFGGYGKGYTFANKVWIEFISLLKDLRAKKKMNIILVAHSLVKAFNDPAQTQSYDRYLVKLNDKAAALFREAVDSVFFATFETFVKKEGSQKAKAFGDGKRVIFTERRPAFDAKNRSGLPFEIDLSWDGYVTALTKAKPDQLKEMKLDIEELISKVTDLELKKIMEKSYKDAGNNAEMLGVILNRIRARLS